MVGTILVTGGTGTVGGEDSWWKKETIPRMDKRWKSKTKSRKSWTRPQKKKVSTRWLLPLISILLQSR